MTKRSRTFSRRWSVAVALLSIAVWFAGCEGWIQASGSADGSGVAHPGASRSGNGSDDSTGWEDRSDAVDCETVHPPGSTPLLRLTETEYNQSVDDLFPDLELSRFEIPGDERLGPFPMNYSTSVDPIVSERYQSAAETISKRVANEYRSVTDCESPGEESTVETKEAEKIGAKVGAAQEDFWNLWKEGDLTTDFAIPFDGTYTLEVVADSTQPEGVGADMEFLVDGKTVDSVLVDASKGAAATYSTSFELKAGTHRIGVRNDNSDVQKDGDRNLRIDDLTLRTERMPADCGIGFIEPFVRRAWRRPPTSDELQRLKTLFEEANQSHGPRFALRSVVEFVLQSPRFLYRFENGESEEVTEGVVPLTDFEVASRLSYFLWNSTPDEKLMEAARQGELSTAEQVESQARRMLEDSRARKALNRAVLALFGLRNFENDETHGGEIDPEVRSAMKRETLAFIDEILWEGDGTIQSLLTARWAYVTPETAPFYEGVTVSEEEGMKRVEFGEDSPRRGILTQPALLARYGHGEKSVFRGLLIRETLLCRRPGDPPDELMNPPERKEEESARSQAEDRMEHEQCGSCHQQMEPMGLAFDRFDARGRYRSTDEHGNELTSEGALVGTDEHDGDIEGPVELARRLADSSRVRTCFSQQWLKRAVARNPVTDSGVCAVESVADAVESADGDLKEMFVAITTTEAFRYKRVDSED